MIKVVAYVVLVYGPAHGCTRVREAEHGAHSTMAGVCAAAVVRGGLGHLLMIVLAPVFHGLTPWLDCFQGFVPGPLVELRT